MNIIYIYKKTRTKGGAKYLITEFCLLNIAGIRNSFALLLMQRLRIRPATCLVSY